NELRRIGIHPDVVVCRSTEPLSDDIRDKIALFADVDRRAVVGSPDVPDVYLVPQVLQAEGLDTLVCEKLALEAPAAELGEWADLIERTRELREDVEIALVGKYVKLHDAYLSVHEALKHAGVHAGCRVHVRWVDAENMSYDEAVRGLEQADDGLVPAAFGARAGARASRRSRPSVSASACMSPCPSSRGTSAGWTVPTRRRWIRRRPTP